MQYLAQLEFCNLEVKWWVVLKMSHFKAVITDFITGVVWGGRTS